MNKTFTFNKDLLLVGLLFLCAISSSAQYIIEKDPSGKYGYKNQDGSWMIEPQFKSAEPFYDDLALVKLQTGYYSSKNALINKKGNIVFQKEGGDISKLNAIDDESEVIWAITSYNNEVSDYTINSMLNNKGTVIFSNDSVPQYRTADRTKIIAFPNWSTNIDISTGKEYKEVIQLRDGKKIIVPHKKDLAHEPALLINKEGLIEGKYLMQNTEKIVSNNRAIILSKSSNGWYDPVYSYLYLTDYKNGKYGIKSTDGEVLVPTVNDSITYTAPDSYNKCGIATYKNGKGKRYNYLLQAEIQSVKCNSVATSNYQEFMVFEENGRNSQLVDLAPNYQTRLFYNAEQNDPEITSDRLSKPYIIKKDKFNEHYNKIDHLIMVGDYLLKYEANDSTIAYLYNLVNNTRLNLPSNQNLDWQKSMSETYSECFIVPEKDNPKKYSIVNKTGKIISLKDYEYNKIYFRGRHVFLSGTEKSYILDVDGKLILEVDNYNWDKLKFPRVSSKIYVPFKVKIEGEEKIKYGVFDLSKEAWVFDIDYAKDNRGASILYYNYSIESSEFNYALIEKPKSNTKQSTLNIYNTDSCFFSIPIDYNPAHEIKMKKSSNYYIITYGNFMGIVYQGKVLQEKMYHIKDIGNEYFIGTKKEEYTKYYALFSMSGRLSDFKYKSIYSSYYGCFEAARWDELLQKDVRVLLNKHGRELAIW